MNNKNWKKDKKVWEYVKKEFDRQNTHVELIASENFPIEEVVRASGNVLTNKYAEGYPSKRYYGGCENVDVIENIAIDRLKKIFKAEHANVQPHSGSQANAAAYLAFLQPNDVILGMDLNAGGHLTHGYKLNFSGRTYKCEFYTVDPKTEKIDYSEVLRIAKAVKPKLIVAGASAYSQIIDFKKFREIADAVGAFLMVDMAHIAGLVAAGVHPSPIPYADVVTSTTHKTLRGPRGGIILCKEKYAKQIDMAVFPGVQGGPLEHVIAAKAICFGEVLKPTWKKHAQQVIKNSVAFCKAFDKKGYRIVSGSTENHLFMLDLKTSVQVLGNEAEKLLHSINITSNKNSIPNDQEKPMVTSGIRFGTAPMTSRGWKEKEFIKLADIIDTCLRNKSNAKVVAQCKKDVIALMKKFPLNYSKEIY